MWVPERFRLVASTLAANGVREGPLYDYITTSLAAYDDLLAHMTSLENESRDKWVAAKDDPRHRESARLAIIEADATVADINVGRSEVDTLLRRLGVRV